MPTTMKTPTLTKTLSAAAIALLALTACGGGSDAENTDEDLPDTDGDAHSMPESDGTFDFTPDTAAASGEELRIEVPQELIDATEDYAENRVLEAVTLRATDETDSQCAIEATYEYRDGAQDEIENNEWSITRGSDQEQGQDMPVDERHSHALFPADDGWIDQDLMDTLTLADDYQSTTFEVDCAASPNDSETALPILFKSLNWQEGNYEIERADGTTDEGSLEQGTTCEDIRSEEESAESRVLCNPPAAGTPTLATAHVTVMASGELHVIDSEVEGFDYEPEHGWIGEDQQVDSDGNVIDQ